MTKVTDPYAAAKCIPERLRKSIRRGNAAEFFPRADRRYEMRVRQDIDVWYWPDRNRRSRCIDIRPVMTSRHDISEDIIELRCGNVTFRSGGGGWVRGGWRPDFPARHPIFAGEVEDLQGGGGGFEAVIRNYGVHRF